MSNLLFRLPGRAEPIGAWLGLLFPELDRTQRRSMIAEGRVLQDGVVIDRPGVVCAPGARIRVEGLGDRSLASLELERTAEREGRWFGLIDGMPWASGSIEAAAGVRLDFRRLVADEIADGLATAGELALAAPPESLAWVEVSGAACCASEVLEALARASMPVVGDLRRGGLGVAGGPRLIRGSDSAGSGGERSGRSIRDESLALEEGTVWRPQARASDPFPVGRPSIDAPVLCVSRETARAIEAGHPWVLPDAASDPATRFRPGSLVQLVRRDGDSLGWAHVEGTERLAARVFGVGAEAGRSLESIDARVARAIARRLPLLAEDPDRRTNAIRLIHGEADGLPGLFVDRLGPLLRILVSGWASEGFRARTLEALRRQLPVSPTGDVFSLLEVLHLRRAATTEVDCVRWIEGGIEAIEAAGFACTSSGFEVEERGLRFEVDPGWDAPRRPRPGFGLFVDQRENRERLAQPAAEGGAWLNLFAHTGAFSVALLAAGAAHVTSVDLSQAYLDRLERNLAANVSRGVDPARHETRRGDVRRYLEALDPEIRFRGIVVDPPTAAAAGRRFWSVRQDLEPLLERVIDRLEPGGVLLVTQNRAGPPIGLDQVLERCLSRKGRAIERLQAATAGPDHPSLPGFPEGEAFEGWCVHLR